MNRLFILPVNKYKQNYNCNSAAILDQQTQMCDWPDIVALKQLYRYTVLLPKFSISI